jgi:hypothetical protein
MISSMSRPISRQWIWQVPTFFFPESGHLHPYPAPRRQVPFYKAVKGTHQGVLASYKKVPEATSRTPISMKKMYWTLRGVKIYLHNQYLQIIHASFSQQNDWSISVSKPSMAHLNKQYVLFIEDNFLLHNHVPVMESIKALISNDQYLCSVLMVLLWLGLNWISFFGIFNSLTHL